MDLNFKIVFNPLAQQNIHDISDYIKYSLGEPDAANRLINEIVKSTDILEIMPELYAVYDKEPWKSRNIRRFPIKNYVVYYKADMPKKTVYILKICYAAQNPDNQTSGI